MPRDLLAEINNPKGRDLLAELGPKVEPQNALPEGDFVDGVFEAGKSIVGGLGTEVVAGLGGIAESAKSQSLVAGADEVNRIRQAGAETFAPETATGQRYVKNIGEAVTALDDFFKVSQIVGGLGDFSNEFVGSVTGSDKAGAIAGAITRAVPEALGFGVPANAIVKSVSNVVKKRTNSKILQVLDDDGSLTPEAREALLSKNQSPTELVEEITSDLKAEGLTPQQIENIDLFQRLNIEPTRFDITQDPSDSVFQRESAKQSGPVQRRLEEQDTVIKSHFDSMFGGRSPEPGEAGAYAATVAFDRVNAVDEAVSQAYNAARAAAPNEKVVNAGRLAVKLKQNAARNPEFIKAVQADLEMRGIINNMSAKGRRISVETAEEARKQIRVLANDDAFKRGSIAGDLIEALDNDVMAAVGQDVFKDARALKHRFEKSIERTRNTKRSAGPETLTQRLLKEQINPAQLVPLITSKATRVDDVAQLKQFYLSGSKADIEAGQDAWNELRSSIMYGIYKGATKGTVQHNVDVAEFSGPKFKNELDKVGNEKLALLFPDQLSLIGQLTRVGEVRMPKGNTRNGAGISTRRFGQDVIEMGTNTLTSDPHVGKVVRIVKELFTGMSQYRAEKRFVQPLKEIEKSLPKRIPSGTGVGDRVH